MKTIAKILLCWIILFSACKPGDFGTINNDPTKVTQAPTRALLTNAIQITLPLTSFGDMPSNSYVQYLSRGLTVSEYGTRNFSWSSNWDVKANIFAGPLANLQTIINYNNGDNPLAGPTNGSKANQLAVARILKAYYFWQLTDRYGDIPYSEALKGNLDFSPKYDEQKEIYYDLFKEFKEAAAQIDPTQLGVQGDILFNGDMAKWKMFANTSRLMMSLRLIKHDSEKGKAEFNDALSGGVLNSNADNVVYKYLAADPANYNPWYQIYTVDALNDQAISNTLVDYMSSQNDPRLLTYGENLNGLVIGLPYGGPPTSIPGAYSRIGDRFRSAGSPSSIFTYAQTLFALAEAAKVGFIGGGDSQAAQYYADAIKASFEYYEVYNDAEYMSFIAQPLVAYDVDNGLEKIMTQKWVHLFLNGYESWSDWRRTGFPKLIPAANGMIQTIPRRLGYPIDEPGINKDNYKEVVDRQGPDDLETRIWWDK